MIYTDRMKSFFAGKKVRGIIIAFLLLLAVPQNIVLFKSVSNIKPVHIFAALLLPVVLIYPSQNRRISKFLLSIVGFVCIQTIIAYAVFGQNTLIINLIFCGYCFFVTYLLADDFSHTDWNRLLRICAWITILLVCGNILWNFEAIWKFMRNPGFYHPVYQTMFGGGPNLDATWAALMCFFLVSSGYWLPGITLSMLVTVFASSRAGLLANLAFIVWMAAQWLRTRGTQEKTIRFWKNWTKKERIISIISTVLILTLFVICQAAAISTQQETQQSQGKGVFSNLYERSTSIGEEPGSLGRMNMWQYVPEEVMKAPLGCGFGNGMEQVRAHSPETISDGNLHNIYFQTLLDMGFPGFVLLLVVIGLFIKAEWRQLFAKPIAAFLLCYLGLGAIQFRLTESIMWTVVGAYYSLKKEAEMHKQGKGKINGSNCLSNRPGV